MADKLLRPLDVVRTPKGAIGVVTYTTQSVKPPTRVEGRPHPEETPYDNYSISFLGDSCGERNAWWGAEDGLLYLDNLAVFLSSELIHPFANWNDKQHAKAVYA